MTNPFFPEIKHRFGFGCMRLPERDEKIDNEEMCRMVDAFLDAGFNYFDTAHGYHGGRSELALRDCLTSRYPRERYLLTNKLTGPYFQTEADIRPFFEKQLADCGVDYFDFYLMHAQNAAGFEKFKACRAYETAFALKAEGKVRHVGLSFHDRAEVLDEILSTYPEVEFVQIQFNYLDYQDVAVDSRRVYEVCVKHDKPVLIMEPIKGGTLIQLPEAALKLVSDLGQTPASLALRFAADFDHVAMVLSGMSNLAQMQENLAVMADPAPLTAQEHTALDKIVEIFRGLHLIPCTGCRYCVEGCPMGILIPDLFQCLNNKTQFDDWNQARYYRTVLTVDHGKPTDCLKCGLCEDICPQGLPIRELLEKVAAAFEKED